MFLYTLDCRAVQNCFKIITSNISLAGDPADTMQCINSMEPVAKLTAFNQYHIMADKKTSQTIRPQIFAKKAAQLCVTIKPSTDIYNATKIAY
jgi:hypothetical protein